MLSSTNSCWVLSVVVVPETVKSPVTVKLRKVGVALVATSCPIATTPEATVTQVPPVIAACALAFVKYKFAAPEPSDISSVTEGIVGLLAKFVQSKK
jgi:hypothetical protein